MGPDTPTLYDTLEANLRSDTKRLVSYLSVLGMGIAWNPHGNKSENNQDILKVVDWIVDSYAISSFPLAAGSAGKQIFPGGPRVEGSCKVT